MKQTRLILVGGFLGSGKTTLLWEAAKRLTKQGFRVGLITNDQAPELVDSAILSLSALHVEEVSGSCFCCNFDGLTHAIQKMRADLSADIILAEPVGSCTDLSATIMQPLKKYWSSEVQVAPLSVLADPSRLDSILNGGDGGLHPDAAYIYRKQLEESDLILVGKTDLLTAAELEALTQRVRLAYPSAVVQEVSSFVGEGLEAWIDTVLTSNEAGKRLVDMNYDTYAHGEAVLGWLNGTVCLKGPSTDWDAFTRTLLSNLSLAFDAGGYAVGHVKLIAENGKQFVVGNLTGTSETLSTRGSAGQSEAVKLTINARVQTTPEKLDAIVRTTLQSLVDKNYTDEVVAWRYLQPGRPQPTHRFAEVVAS